MVNIAMKIMKFLEFASLKRKNKPVIFFTKNYFCFFKIFYPYTELVIKLELCLIFFLMSRNHVLGFSQQRTYDMTAINVTSY